MSRISRFERTHIVGMLVLESTAEGHSSLTYDEASDMVERGDFAHFIRRRYTDGSTALFRVGPKGTLVPRS